MNDLIQEATEISNHISRIEMSLISLGRGMKLDIESIFFRRESRFAVQEFLEISENNSI